jgi:hypothetical protein
MVLTTYERARLRLRAFELLSGWGAPNEMGVHIPHTFERRKEVAEKLVEWAIADPSQAQTATTD